jgi:AraC-like DNA-binding protein
VAGRAVLVVEVGAGAERVDQVATHAHSDPLLAWSDSATVAVNDGGRSWIVPPGSGLWIPADTPHAIQVLRSGSGSALAFDRERCRIAWPEPTAVAVTPLVRELIRHLARRADTSTDVYRHGEAFLLDLLEPAPATTVAVPLPTDDRLRKITNGLLADPADDRDLARWAYDVGAGVRTITRLFAAQTGMTFGQWRTHARIRAAITLLADGTPVGTTARRVGFTKPAAFTEAFRRVTGQLPSAFGPVERGG